MTIVSKDLLKAAEILSKEELVAIPTETVYGLAGNIYSETAIKKIFEMKNRPFFNPLIVHIHSVEQVEDLAVDFPEKAQELAKAFWPGSLTLVLKKNDKVPDLITAGKDTVGIRMPNHSLTLELLRNLDFPVAAPSANPFTHISPTTAQHVKNYFDGKLEMVLDGGNCTNGIESTIVGFENGEPVVYRLGSISVEEIERVVGKVSVRNNKEQAPNAPGMLEKHYAPRTKTYLVQDISAFIKQHPDKKIGLLLHSTDHESFDVSSITYLSKTGNLKEAASRLYSAMHEMDQLDLDMIIAQRLPDYDLGKSINDRLERATK
ncbi:L-threonylcarbamoyladenylate synthase [Nonlabens dokdonensis]|jgi:L-threonylcarbamoyladenylate synthase|uniref:Threonylcarbamoyl-AMP synthase n=2 Tax=Nonlabens dokdonensis TaxID=328515 RepID=L7WC94_NONDD|nr:L-threonylcarbamoyladenylate synthase [Nonlabens dokdonensis]AGC76528.1 Sua5/YciO/YrdC/YwlC translation factor [Nonlabens dokdonensis DSW-6]PZX44179.1 L-threonylcarbamoyladenylate synthase [Nonlabens dokdonensis]